MANYNWAILGTGGIGSAMAETLLSMGKKVYGAANRTYEKAAAFGKKYGVEKIYEDYDQLFQDPAVHIIYIATPHNSHYQYIMKALEAGKHVLCEKAITMNSLELNRARLLADEKKLLLAEAMTIYHMPLYQQLKERIDRGDLGKVKLIQVNFGCRMEYDERNRFFSKELAGGALLDIGVYALSFARYFLSMAPDEVLACANFSATGVDELSGIILRNQEGQMVVTALSFNGIQPKRGCVICEKGYIEIMEYPRAEKAQIHYTENSTVEEVEGGDERQALEYEVNHMEEALTYKKSHPEAYEEAMELMKHTFTRDVMEVMTDIRRQWGLSYSFEAVD